MIGNTQTLSIGGLSLTLTKDNFDGSQHNRLGYHRWYKVSHQLEVSQSFWGASLIDGPAFSPKLEFEWALHLGDEKAELLEAIWLTQQATRAPVRLVDERISLLSENPRIRARKGSTGRVIGGREVFWPQFDVLLTLPKEGRGFFFERMQDGYNKVKLLGSELDLVSVEEDE